MAELHLGKQRGELLQMIGKPEIVIAEMRNEIAGGLLKQGVAVPLAVSLALVEFEHADPRIVRGDCARNDCGLRRAVAHDEQLEIAVALPKHRLHRERQQLRQPMHAQQDGEARRCHLIPIKTFPPAGSRYRTLAR
jgi:hypothetical protein